MPASAWRCTVSATAVFDAGGEGGFVDRFALLLLLDQRPQIVGPRQAADMRRQDAIGAALHLILPAFAQCL